MQSKKTIFVSLQVILLALFSILAVWWGVLFFYYNLSQTNSNLVWGASYQVIALFGAVSGIIVSYLWGGSKSHLGRAILAFSIGLFLQNFGQTIFSVYNLFLKTDLPYPSLSDIGFFGSVIFYIYGAYLLGEVCGIKLSFNKFYNKLIFICVPVVLLAFSYIFFLRGYVFDFSNPLKVFLDFGYPLCEAFYISLAILAFILSKTYLGGVMRSTILLVLGALCLQYVAEFNFLFQAGNSTWINGGYGDFLYMISYCFMALALIRFGVMFNRIENHD